MFGRKVPMKDKLAMAERAKDRDLLPKRPPGHKGIKQ